MAKTGKARRKLTPRQTAVLAAVERLGQPGMLELSAEFNFAPSEIARVLEVLEQRGLVARSGDPALIYTGGVRFWATARNGEPDTEWLRSLLDALTQGEVIAGWIEPDQRAVVVYLPLCSVERQLLEGDDERFECLSARIRELRGNGRLAGIDVAAAVSHEKGEAALKVSLAPPPPPSAPRAVTPQRPQRNPKCPRPEPVMSGRSAES